VRDVHSSAELATRWRVRLTYFTMLATLSSVVHALAAAEPATQPISVETALLLILGLALLFAFKSLARLHRRVDALHAAKTAKRNAASAVSPPPNSGLPPELLAVISAAVFESLGADSRIVAISLENENHTWSMEGRRQIFGSRKVR